MALTPAELRSPELPRTLRGYSVEATESLLGRAAAALEAAFTERDRLVEEMRRLETDVGAQPEQKTDVGDTERLIGEALLAATRAADELKEQAKRDCEAAIAEAQAQAREVLAAAEREGDVLKAEANKQAEALVEEAKAEAGTILGGHEQERKHLEAEAERLRELTDQTSADLRSLLVGMLEKLETKAAEAPAQPSVESETGEAQRDEAEEAPWIDQPETSSRVPPMLPDELRTDRRSRSRR